MAGLARPACYVASPCGFADSTRLWYETVLLPLVAAHATVLDPWSIEFDGAGDYEAKVDLGKSHFATIEQRADLVVAVLDQEPPDNGTVAEVSWAAAKGIPVIAYRGDFRASGEQGMPYNLMISAAVRLSGGAEVSSVDALELELRALIRARPPDRPLPARRARHRGSR